jgi:hypothetical protein
MRPLNPYAQESCVFCAIFEPIPTFGPEFDKINDISIDLFYRLPSIRQQLFTYLSRLGEFQEHLY